MFESISELTNIDYATERKRFVLGSVVAVICWSIISAICVIASMFKPIIDEPVYGDRNVRGNLVVLTTIAPLPPTPRTIRESSSRPTGNAQVEREIVTPNAKTDTDRAGRQFPNSPGQEPPNIGNTNAAVSTAPGGGPMIINNPAVAQPVAAPPPPPPPQNQDQQSQPSSLADDIKSKIRHSTITDPSAIGSGGQKGMRLDGGAGVDLGANKALLEKRMWTAWQRTKSEYADMQRAGRAVVVYFDWYRDGHLVFTGFGTRSGNAALDNEARNAVQNASPFYPIPKEITMDVIHLNATFTY